MPKIYMVPGWHSSGPDHWQTLWEARHPDFIRVEQSDWQEPELDAWVARLNEYISRESEQAILVAHSLGCVAVAHWAQASRDSAKVAAALLVAPPCFPDQHACPAALHSFLPVPQDELPFPSVLVASRNDPYISFEQAQKLSESWGSTFVDAGAAGHINDESGYGPWPEGFALLQQITDVSESLAGIR